MADLDGGGILADIARESVVSGSRVAGPRTPGRALGEEMSGNQQPKFGAKRTRIERDTRGES